MNVFPDLLIRINLTAIHHSETQKLKTAAEALITARSIKQFSAEEIVLTPIPKLGYLTPSRPRIGRTGSLVLQLYQPESLRTNFQGAVRHKYEAQLTKYRILATAIDSSKYALRINPR